MIRISQLKLPCGYTEGALENKIRKTLRIQDRPLHFTIVRHSVDARKKPLLFDMYPVDVDTKLSPKAEASLLRRLKNKNITPAPRDQYRFPDPGSRIRTHALFQFTQRLCTHGSPGADRHQILVCQVQRCPYLPLSL